MRKVNVVFGTGGLIVIAGLVILSRQRVSAQGVGNTALLYSFVTNQAGFDTGLVITNASLNPFGATGRSGTCSINYYGTVVGIGFFAIPPQTTTVIPAGSQVTFTLSNGGGAGIAATPGFQGYVIATCNFPQAQGVAAITDLGATKYLSLVPATVIPAF